jgi:radical SAM protein with 4Fe4S-binding SPASM domain
MTAPSTTNAGDLFDASRYSRGQIEGYKADNERRVRAAARNGDVFVDGLPLKITLELTADCNLYCRMCEFPVPREKGRGRYDMDMPLETFRMLAPQVFPHARIVNLTVVGEPLMVPYLDEVLEECRKWGTKLELITNGMLLDAKMIERVGPYAGCVIISFDGGTRRTFNRIRIGGDFNVVTRNMWNFHQWRLRRPPETWPGFHMAVTLMRENIEELPLLVEIAHLLHVDKLCGAWMISFNEKIAQSSPLKHRALANKCLRAARRRAEELGVLVALPADFADVPEAEVEAAVMKTPEMPNGPLPHLTDLLSGKVAADTATWAAPPAAADLSLDRDVPPAPHLSRDEMARQAVLNFAVPAAEPAFLPGDAEAAAARYTCKFLWNELFVNVSGDVAPCCIQGRPVVGNVHDGALSEIWNNAPMKEMRARLLSGNPIPCCKDCNYNTQLGQGTYREDTFFVKLDRKV